MTMPTWRRSAAEVFSSQAAMALARRRSRLRLGPLSSSNSTPRTPATSGDDSSPPGGVSVPELREYLRDLVSRLARLASWVV